MARGGGGGNKRKRTRKTQQSRDTYEHKQDTIKAKQYKEHAERLEEAKDEVKQQKMRKRNAPTPIAKRKPLGEKAMFGGMREIKEKKRVAKEQRQAEREARREAKGEKSGGKKRQAVGGVERESTKEAMEAELVDISAVIAGMGGSA